MTQLWIAIYMECLYAGYLGSPGDARRVSRNEYAASCLARFPAAFMIWNNRAAIAQAAGIKVQS